MKNKTIKTSKAIKGDLIAKGKLIFLANLGRIEISGKIEATLGIEIGIGTNIYSKGYIHSKSYISSKGNIYSKGYIYSESYIYSEGDIHSESYIYVSFFLKFGAKISCKILRISTNENLERNYWIDKMNLFGFPDVANAAKDGCVDTIRERLTKCKNVKAVLKFKYWTSFERMVIKSWINGELKDYKLK